MNLTDEHLRALRVLATAGPGGVSQTVLIEVQALKLQVVDDLVKDGLANARTDVVRVGGQTVERMRVVITPEGRDKG
jgi:hypothetical protein